MAPSKTKKPVGANANHLLSTVACQVTLSLLDDGDVVDKEYPRWYSSGSARICSEMLAVGGIGLLYVFCIYESV